MISFLPFQERHLVIFRRWLGADHIRPVWQETEDDERLRVKFREELPRRGVRCFVIAQKEAPVGFIQYYDAKKVDGGWWEQERAGVFGIDLLIGEPCGRLRRLDSWVRARSLRRVGWRY